MVFISKVYTRFGDGGQTMLASGEAVSKASLRVWCYGEVDELNAVVGLVRDALARETAGEFGERVGVELAAIQQQLFNLGAELASSDAASSEPSSMPRVRDDHVESLERAIDAHNAGLEPLRSFVLPGGGPASASAHLARTVCRRAERRLVELAGQESVRGETTRYLNRLSDYFFVLARACAHTFGHEETLWDSRST